MAERQLVSKFVKELKEKDPSIFFEVLKDTGTAGHKKPFDAFAVVNGVPFAFEFKVSDGKLRPHQREALVRFDKNGGCAFMAVFRKDKKALGFYFLREDGVCDCILTIEGTKSGWFVGVTPRSVFGSLIIAYERAREVAE